MSLLFNYDRTSPACPPGFGVLNNDLSLSSNEIVPLLRICSEKVWKQKPIIEMTLSHTTYRYKLYSAFQPYNALRISNVVCSYCNFDEYTVKAWRQQLLNSNN